MTSNNTPPSIAHSSDTELASDESAVPNHLRQIPHPLYDSESDDLAILKSKTGDPIRYDVATCVSLKSLLQTLACETSLTGNVMLTFKPLSQHSTRTKTLPLSDAVSSATLADVYTATVTAGSITVTWIAGSDGPETIKITATNHQDVLEELPVLADIFPNASRDELRTRLRAQNVNDSPLTNMS